MFTICLLYTSVRRRPGYQAQQNVAIEGEILFGVNYAMTSREERLSDLVNKAGGPTSLAYLRGAKLTRVASAGEKKRCLLYTSRCV